MDATGAEPVLGDLPAPSFPEEPFKRGTRSSVKRRCMLLKMFAASPAVTQPMYIWTATTRTPSTRVCHFIETGTLGRIVCTTSTVGFLGNFGQSNVDPAKAASSVPGAVAWSCTGRDQSSRVLRWRRDGADAEPSMAARRYKMI